MSGINISSVYKIDPFAFDSFISKFLVKFDCSSVSFYLIWGFSYLQFRPDALHRIETPLKA